MTQDTAGISSVVATLTDNAAQNKRGRGRPRVYPQTETATDRVNRSVKRLISNGGARRTFRLTPEGNNALVELRRLLGKNDDTSVVNDCLVRVVRAIKNKRSLG